MSRYRTLLAPKIHKSYGDGVQRFMSIRFRCVSAFASVNAKIVKNLVHYISICVGDFYVSLRYNKSTNYAKLQSSVVRTAEINEIVSFKVLIRNCPEIEANKFLVLISMSNERVSTARRAPSFHPILPFQSVFIRNKIIWIRKIIVGGRDAPDYYFFLSSFRSAALSSM